MNRFEVVGVITGREYKQTQTGKRFLLITVATPEGDDVAFRVWGPAPVVGITVRLAGILKSTNGYSPLDPTSITEISPEQEQGERIPQTQHFEDDGTLPV